MHIFELMKAGMHRCTGRHSLNVMLLGLENKVRSLEYYSGFLFHLKTDIIKKNDIM